MITRRSSLLDVGCAFGTDIRQFIIDGVEQNQLYGIDVTDTFFNLGLELFGDNGKNSQKFLNI